jgi:hypothetical protein
MTTDRANLVPVLNEIAHMEVEPGERSTEAAGKVLVSIEARRDETICPFSRSRPETDASYEEREQPGS